MIPFTMIVPEEHILRYTHAAHSLSYLPCHVAARFQTSPHVLISDTFDGAEYQEIVNRLKERGCTSI